MSVKKLYCYVDETGQDTKGKFFLVAVVLEEKEDLEILQSKLDEVEKSTKKNRLKWTKAPFKVRVEYLLRLADIRELKGSIFYSAYQDTKEYIPLTSLTIAKAVLSKEEDDYTVTIIIDGLKDREMQDVRKELKKLKINYRKIRGMKDEQDPILRLADSIAGFLRDSLENQSYAKSILDKFRRAKVITKV